MNKGNLFITRHGETEANLTGAIVGITDVNLTKKGKTDAYKIGEQIGKKIDLIITSPQTRAGVSGDIIRKYNGATVVETPTLHPQNFGAIEGMTLDEARQNGLGEYLHKEDTNKYLHKGKNGESAKEMESRVIPELFNILKLTCSGTTNTLLVTHNSLLRCLLGNVEGLPPQQWIENHIGNGEIFKFYDPQNIQKIQGKQETENPKGLKVLLDRLFENTNLKEDYNNSFLSKFAKLALHEEEFVMQYLNDMLPCEDQEIIEDIINKVKNTIELDGLMAEMKEFAKVDGIITLLHFGSSIYGRNYLVHDTTDLDIEIVIDENFDIKTIKDSILSGYEQGDVESDFADFICAGADYFSFKSYYKGRLIDFRITQKKCLEKIFSNTLQEGDEYVMKEFRKKFRPNGIVKKINGFDQEFVWENKIDFVPEGQIINYPLFKYIDGVFSAGNNLDKYCSFTDIFKDEIKYKKQLHELRINFLKVFNNQKEQGLIDESSNVSDIFIRIDRFPQYMIDDLESRYKVFNLLYNINNNAQN